ncbi:SDR family NAD(P)-dependent oxidoreductase [Saccharopolyspora sp. MS10]|uniref:SDR family NAD(P)-dependent oxidoreductase n=1 Tax=Saccharopolyspora sp. MS10 TaxID=3385973 RepID=UPI0039A04A9B
MSTPIASLDELHRLISEGRIEQGEALRLLRAHQRGAAPAPPKNPSIPENPSAPAGPAPEQSTEDLAERVREIVLEKVCALLKVDVSDLDVDVELSEYGLDSLIISQLVNLVNESLGLELVPTVLFEHPTLRAFSAFVAAEHGTELAAALGQPVEVAEPEAPQPVPAAAVPPPEEAPPAERPGPASRAPAAREGDDPIAIVGISGRFPKAADLDEFWENLRAGRDCVDEVPADRWDWRAHHGDPLQEPGRTRAKHGGFVDGIAEFDPLFFGIAPKDAVHMDPQQRLLMLYAWKALEDAGHSAEELAGSDLALFVGTHDTGYGLLAERSAARSRGVTPTGSVPSVGPNRMSYFLDVHGPSEPVETACSSSLVAMHRAVAALERGETGMAVVGGVNTIVVPDGHVSFSRSGMLSEDGRCKSFSADADGYSRGEGVGMLVLKPLSAAERDGNHVYGLIRATAENHGGRANSLTSPNPKAQAAVIRRAHAGAGIDPRTVGYVEAHGTGTRLGDPIEINGLKEAFAELAGDAPVPAGRCGIGSVKTNIGHLELAAGVAGVLKVLLQLRHRTLVPSLHAERINPLVKLEGSPFRLVRESEEWVAPRDERGDELPRRAGVSSFGFGGVNAHVVLEEYRPPAARREPAAGPVAIVLSAAGPETLRARARQLVERIDAGGLAETDLPDLAHTLQVGRTAMAERLAFLAHSLAEVRQRLAAHVAGGRPPGLHLGRAERRGVWAELAGDEDIATAIDGWVAKGKLGRLLKLWVTGFDFDWKRLHAGRPARRLPLPSYPFALRRYWIADGDRAAAAPVPERPEHRHELGGADSCLRDHRVGDVPTLPGAAYLEFARAALGATAGVRLCDVTWLRPLPVTAPRSLLLEVDPDSGAFRACVEDSGERVPHAQGTARVEQDLPAAEVHDLDALRAMCPVRHDGTEIYRLFSRMGMGYGSAFRAIEHLHRGDDLAVARLRLPVAAAGAFELNPAMLDGALQTTLGLVLSEEGAAPEEAALPFAVREVRVLAPTPEAGWAVARRSADDRRDSGVRRLDVDLCDESGAVCVRILGFGTRARPRSTAEARPVQTAPVEKTPVETALLVEPAWAPAAAPEPAADPAERHVLLCELPGVDPDELGGLLGATCTARVGSGGLDERYTAHAEHLLALLREQARGAAHRLVQVVVPGDAPWLAGLAGMLRTAQLEHPKLRAQLVEVDPATPLAALADQVRRDAADVEQPVVRHRDGGREISRWREIAAPAARPPWRDGGVYLLTGGAGGLGALVAEEIARRVDSPALVLCGRSPAGPAQEELLTRLRASGAKADYRALDVADGADVRRAVREVEARHGALHGVVHAAGVLRDGFLARKTAEDLRQVFAAKVSGVRHLDEATAGSALECFLCFSSMAAFGNVGQADYAAANGFLDGYAAHRESLVARGERSGRTLVVNWPLWEEGGMGGTASTARLLESAGMRPMRAEVGLDALHRAWAARRPQVIALDGDPARLRERFLPDEPTAEPRDAGNRAHEDRAHEDRAHEDRAGDAGPGGARGADVPDAAALLPVVADLMAALLEIEPAALPRNEPLTDYGFDSIFMMQFLTQVQAHVDAGLTLDVIAGCDTLHEIVEAIATALAPARPAPEIPRQRAEVPPGAARPAPVPATEFPELVRMNGVTEGRPVFWVHHGNGGVESYAPVAARVRRPFYGIQPKGWIDGTEILTGQVPMAEFYADLVRAVQPEGPYDIGGFSLGGLFAYEVVRQLQLRGAEVRSLVMLDTLDAEATNAANDIIVGGDHSPEIVSKVSDYRAVNLILGNNSFESHQDDAPILRRDEVDPALDGPAFLDSLIRAALDRGVKKNEAQLRSRVRQLARYLEATQGERYELRELPRPDELSCYYLRNASGEFFGAFREYMVLLPDDSLPQVDGTEYWRGWAERIDDFFTIDVDTSMHSEVMTAPAALEKLLRLCDRLYAPETGRGGR